jgi:hypothetical protein
MIENPSNIAPSTRTAATPNGPSRDAVHSLCRLLSVLAWSAIVLWILAPKGSRWGSAAGDAGLAWILFTGGGCFAEATVRSFVHSWKEFLASWNRTMRCRNQEHSPR